MEACTRKRLSEKIGNISSKPEHSLMNIILRKFFIGAHFDLSTPNIVMITLVNVRDLC